MEVEGHYDNLELQNVDDTTYENLRTMTKKEKDLLKILRADIRRYKRVGASLGLLCAVLALLNIAVPFCLYQSNMVERQKLLSSFDELQNKHNNLTEQKGQLQSSLDKLETRYDKLEARYDKLETTRYTLLTEEREQLQTRINKLTKERDDMKMRLCESPGWQKFDRGCYYISTEEKTWEESRQWCRDRQSDLMVINSKEKQDFVASFKKRVWLGLTDKERDGRFKWVDGTPLTTPTYWFYGEPNNKGGDEVCVEFPTTINIGWNDQLCSYPNYWICERVMY